MQILVVSDNMIVMFHKTFAVVMITGVVLGGSDMNIVIHNDT